MNKQYTWTEYLTDDIWYNGKFGSIEECIEDAISCGKKPGEKIVIGICNDYIPYIDVNGLLEQVEQDAYEEVGEVAEDWLMFEPRKGYKNVNKLREKINKVFNEWLKETNQQPTFYHIEPIKEIIIP